VVGKYLAIFKQVVKECGVYGSYVAAIVAAGGGANENSGESGESGESGVTLFEFAYDHVDTGALESGVTISFVAPPKISSHLYRTSLPRLVAVR
jgi:hypothetical protein